MEQLRAETQSHYITMAFAPDLDAAEVTPFFPRTQDNQSVSESHVGVDVLWPFPINFGRFRLQTRRNYEFS